MIIKTLLDAGGRKRTTYYVAMSNGRVITGGKNKAAVFDSDTAAKVLRHLQQVDHRFAEAELVTS